MSTRAEFHDWPLMAFRGGAIVVAAVSGFCALAALCVGSPLAFGTALAICGASWVVADFIEWMVGREGGAGRRLVPVVLPTGYASASPHDRGGLINSLY